MDARIAGRIVDGERDGWTLVAHIPLTDPVVAADARLREVLLDALDLEVPVELEDDWARPLISEALRVVEARMIRRALGDA